MSVLILAASRVQMTRDTLDFGCSTCHAYMYHYLFSYVITLQQNTKRNTQTLADCCLVVRTAGT